MAKKKLLAKVRPATKSKPASKAAPKKLLAKPAAKSQAKTASRKAVAKPQTKTAQRKAARAAKSAAKPATKKLPRLARTSWPPLVELVLKALDEGKGEQIVTMDMTGKSTVADTVIVASGRSNRHVNALADQAVDVLHKQGVKNIRIEGVPQCDWVLVDAGDIILHVFRPEVRSFYNLEKLLMTTVPEQ